MYISAEIRTHVIHMIERHTSHVSFSEWHWMTRISLNDTEWHVHLWMTREMYVCLYTCDCERHTSLVSFRDIHAIARHTHRVNVYIWRDPPLCYTSHRKRYLSFRDIHMIVKHTHRANVHIWRDQPPCYTCHWETLVAHVVERQTCGCETYTSRECIYLEISAPLLYVSLRDVRVIEGHTYDCETYTSSEYVYLERVVELSYVSLRDGHVMKRHTYDCETNTSSEYITLEISAPLSYVSLRDTHVMKRHTYHNDMYVFYICMSVRQTHQVEIHREISPPCYTYWCETYILSEYISGDISLMLYVSLRDTRTKCIHFWRYPWEVGGWGQDPKNGTGRDWGMGSSTI